MPIWNEVNHKIIGAASQLSVDSLSINCDILYRIRRIYVPAEYYSITPACTGTDEIGCGRAIFSNMVLNAV